MDAIRNTAAVRFTAKTQSAHGPSPWERGWGEVFAPLRLCGFLLCFSWQAVSAQQRTISIDLATVLQIAGADNATIKQVEAQQALAVADRTKAREWWLPELQVGAAIHQLNGAAMNGDGRFFTDVDRQNFGAGLGLSAAWKFGDGPMMAKAADMRAQAMQYHSAAERNAALLETIETYYDLLAADRERVAYDRLVHEADTVAGQLEVTVSAGSGYTSDLLMAKSNAAHLRIAMLRAEARKAEHAAHLQRLLAIDGDVDFVLANDLLVPVALDVEPQIIFQNTPYASRPELYAANFNRLAAEQEKRITTSGLLLPELRVGTNGSYFGDVFTPLYATGEVNAALLWRFPIGRLTSGGALKQANARIAIQDNALKQADQMAAEDHQRASAQLRLSKQQLELASISADLAQQAFDQTTQRQTLGLVRPFEVLQAQEMHLTAQLDRIHALVALNKAQYRLWVAMGKGL